MAEKSSDNYLDNFLYQCVETRSVKCVKSFIRREADVTYLPYKNANSTLMNAVIGDNIEIAKLILKANSSEEFVNYSIYQNNVFTKAAEESKFKTFKFITERFPDLTAKSTTQYGPEILASICKDEDIERAKIKYDYILNKDLEFLNQSLMDNVFVSCIYADNTELMKYLFKKAEQLNRPYIPSNDSDLLNHAALADHNAMGRIQILISANTSKEFFWHKGKHKRNFIEQLLVNRSNGALTNELEFALTQINQDDLVTHKTFGGSTLLHLAVEEKNLPAIKRILEINENSKELFLIKDNENKLPINFRFLGVDPIVKRILFSKAPKEIKSIYINECYQTTNVLRHKSAQLRLRLFCEQLENSMTSSQSLPTTEVYL